MDKKKFPLRDILTVTTGLWLSSPNPAGLTDLLSHMIGFSLYTHQLPSAAELCLPFIRHQHPQLFTKEMDREVKDLVQSISPDEFVESKIIELIDTWLAKQIITYGESLEVSPIPESSHLPPQQ